MSEPDVRTSRTEKGSASSAQVRRRTLSSRSSYASSGRRGTLRRSRKRRRKKIVFWSLLVALIGVLAWSFWLIWSWKTAPRRWSEPEPIEVPSPGASRSAPR